MNFKIALSAVFFLSSVGSTVLAATSYIPSNLDRAREIFVMYNGSNRYLVSDLISLVNRKNPTLPDSDKISVSVLASESMMEDLNALLKSSPSSYVHANLIQIDDEIGGANDWMQDTGEFYYDNNGKTKFLSHQASPQWDLGGFLSRERGVKKIVVGEPSADGSIEGGNIESTPGGTVYVGDDLNSDLLKALQNLVGANQVMSVPTGFSNVGHVDESYQFLPARKDLSNGCGYVLAHTDYLDGLRIAMAFDLFNGRDEAREGASREVRKQQYAESLAYYTGVKVSEIQYTKDYFEKTLLPKFNFSKMPREFSSLLQFRKEDVYVYKVFQVQKQLMEGVNSLKTKVATEGCRDLKTVALPGMWTYGFNSETPVMTDDVSIVLAERTSTLTAFTNLVVINDAVVIPDTKVPSQLLFFIDSSEFDAIGAKLKEIVGTRLEGIGFKNEDIIFTDVAGSILGDGAAHCKTNVRRSH